MFVTYFYICPMRLLPTRKLPFLLVAFLLTIAVHGQKKEKVKGSRIVSLAPREVNDFTSLEIEDNIEVFLTQGSKCDVQIEADDNLHDAFTFSEAGGNLRISLSKEIYNAKKIGVKITFTDDLKLIIAKDDTYVTALTDMTLADLTFKTSGSAKLFATVRATTFTMMQNDKSKVELNLNAQNTTIELNKNSQLKSLITSPKLRLDMYQKSLANIEGDCIELRLRMDGNTNLTGKNLTAQQADIITESNANLSIMVEGRAVLETSGKADIELYGEPKIEIRKFTDNASLRHRPVK